ncbi:MAG TPA: DUF3179 domain-containing (seleno)protein [Chitinophagaceae bacterium]|nr:DUF3179 domain-containing (seleno)protein [Chitinophagaceae bacterium]
MKKLAIAILSLPSNFSFSSEKKIPVVLGRAVVILLILILFLVEISRVYLVMPFPGSQRKETVDIAHWISTHIVWIRILTFTMIGIALIRVFKQGKLWEKITLPLVLVAYIPVFALFNYRFDAESIFHQPANKSFVPVAASIDKSKLVIGIVVNGEAKAYPIQLIGYHHQVMDTVGNEPIIITYCTVCRTGRAYSTLVNGRYESFRLVGMDHFNAVFEDETTKTWWQQATGKAIAGPLKGSALKEIPSHQLTINSWMRQYPNSMVMEPDSLYEERYFKLEDYDRGTMQSPLVKRDYRPWQPKSWVVGVKNEFSAVAYDWNELVKKRLIQDSLQDLPILLAMESDTTSFHVYDRRINGSVLQFNSSISGNCLTDWNTNSTWNMDGLCIEGVLKGQRLIRVQAYNEFWHAWKTFQVNTKKYVSSQ